MHATTWKQLDDSMRLELEALLKAPTSAFLSDYNDALAWWILLLVACVGGVVAAVWNIATDTMGLADFGAMLSEHPLIVLRSPMLFGLIVALVLGTWTAITAVRNYGRRGFAALDHAIVVVRGPKLKVLRYAEIASAERRVIGARGSRFTVLTLKLKNGKSVEINVHGTWAEQVVNRIES